jgi:hypothetical protein
MCCTVRSWSSLLEVVFEAVLDDFEPKSKQTLKVLVQIQMMARIFVSYAIYVDGIP